MVQIVENWSRVTGTVEAFAPSGDPQRPGVLSLRISAVCPVEPFADLMAGWEGRTIEVPVPASLLPRLDLVPGRSVTLRLRRGGPTAVFSHPEEPG